MIELKTPSEIIDILIETIEKTRKKNKLRQIDLCKSADVPLATYQNFLYSKTISLISLIKVMYVLKMNNNLEKFIYFEETISLKDIRLIKKKKTSPKRIRISDEKR
ncbi:MAG: hypothetical protein QG567_2021 [Campylobacterota bacterium]|nr:hypothetical protein [Campylobacterota bacterium]